MKFRIQQKMLEGLFSKVKGAVAKNNTKPILKGIFLKVDKENKEIILRASDLEVDMKVIGKDESNLFIEESGSTVVTMKFYKLVKQRYKNDKNQIINIELDEDSNLLTISNPNSNFELNCYNGDEFPKSPDFEGNTNKFSISKAELDEAIKLTSFSLSSDETQPALTGLYLDLNRDKIDFVGTNTYRLADYTLNTTHETLDENTNSIILPAKGLKGIKHFKNDENIKVEFTKNYAAFIQGNYTLKTRLIEGKYPNYKQVLPESSNIEINIDRNKLINSLKGINIVSDNDTTKINLEDEKLIVSTPKNNDGGQVEEKLDYIDKQGEKDDLEIHLGANYLLDVLKKLSADVVTLGYNDKLSPLSVVPHEEKEKSEYLYVIMPVRAD